MDPILTALVEHGPPIINAKMQMLNHCIAATAIALEVLRYFKISCEPLSVDVLVYNEAFTLWIEKYPTESIEGNKAYLEMGAHHIMLNPHPASARWGGHLVISLSQSILDLNLDQFNRPDKGINFPSGAIIAPFESGATLKTDRGAGDPTIRATVPAGTGKSDIALNP